MTQETTPIPSQEELAATVGEVPWDALRPHLERDALILVNGSLDLADAGHALARDNAPLVREWISSGKIGKPNPSQLALWDAERHSRMFLILVIQPYVLIQEIPPLVQ